MRLASCEWKCTYCGRIRKDRTATCISCGGVKAIAVEGHQTVTVRRSNLVGQTFDVPIGVRSVHFHHELGTTDFHYKLFCEDGSTALLPISVYQISRHSFTVHFPEPTTQPMKFFIFSQS